MEPIETTSEWAALAAVGNDPVDLRNAFAESTTRLDHDASTDALICRYRAGRNRR